MNDHGSLRKQKKIDFSEFQSQKYAVFTMTSTLKIYSLQNTNFIEFRTMKYKMLQNLLPKCCWQPY